jgi:hypothetical protein
LGADSPLLNPEHLKHALSELTRKDAVIGPSFDGGFYLLGVNKFPADLLSNVPWSTAQTRQRTLERLSDCGMTVAQLDSLGDVDTVEDLRTLREALKTQSPEIAPATREWFARQRLK